MWIKAVILPYLALGFAPARRPVTRRAVPRMIQTDIDVGYAREIPPFGRKIVPADRLELVVANVGGEFYAVDVKHPFLPVSLAQGEITLDADGPCITVNLPVHSSKFSLVDGSCCKTSGLFAGGAQPATAFPVIVDDEAGGRLSVDLTARSVGYAAAPDAGAGDGLPFSLPTGLPFADWFEEPELKAMEADPETVVWREPWWKF